MKQILAPNRIAALGVAMVLGALASAVFHSFLFFEFVPIRIGVVDEEHTASRRIVAITLPDLSSLRGQTAVLSFQLRNAGSEPKRIGLLRDGIPASRVDLPPNRTVRWDIALSPELIQTLNARGSDGTRTLELTGDADAWAVMAFEIRNYHLRWGERVSAAVIPTSAGGYRVFLSPSALFLLATAIFAPVGLYLISKAPALVPRFSSFGDRPPRLRVAGSATR